MVTQQSSGLFEKLIRKAKNEARIAWEDKRRLAKLLGIVLTCNLLAVVMFYVMGGDVGLKMVTDYWGVDALIVLVITYLFWLNRRSVYHTDIFDNLNPD